MNDKALKLVREINEQLQVDELLETFDIYTQNTVWSNGHVITFCPIHNDKFLQTLYIDLFTHTFKCECPQCAGHRGGDLLDLYCMGTNSSLRNALQFWAKRLELPYELTDTAFK